MIKQSAADVVLMDLQYAPSVLASPAYAAMEKLIAEVAERNRVGLFRRFEIMRHWLSAAPAHACESGAAPRTAISADGLHMTDRSYACLAAGLADAIAQNWRQYQAARASAGLVARLHGAPDSDASRTRRTALAASDLTGADPASIRTRREPRGFARVSGGLTARCAVPTSALASRGRVNSRLTNKIGIGNRAALI